MLFIYTGYSGKHVQICATAQFGYCRRAAIDRRLTSSKIIQVYDADPSETNDRLGERTAWCRTVKSHTCKCDQHVVRKQARFLEKNKYLLDVLGMIATLLADKQTSDAVKYCE